jgi:hypothetical protein
MATTKCFSEKIIAGDHCDISHLGGICSNKAADSLILNGERNVYDLDSWNSGA